MKKKLSIITYTTAVLVAAIALTACNTVDTSSNQLPKQSEVPSSNQSSNTDKQIKPYGTLVQVKGKNMNVYTVGEGEQTIVWIPGLGDIAPGLSYTKMLEELSPHYRVVVVEPFGYGLSDVIDEERTIENITEEIHEAVKQIGVDKYILMGHSISGVYAMKYINSYRDEVTAFIGLDSSVPNMLDEISMNVEPSTTEDIPPIPEVSDEVNEQYRLIAEKVLYNKNERSENKLMKENFEESKKYPFPSDLPVCFFLATESIEGWKMFPVENRDWVKMHSDLVKDSGYSKIYEIDSHHLLYQTHYKEITEKLNEFLSGIPTA